MLCVLVFILNILKGVEVESACDRYRQLNGTVHIFLNTEIILFFDLFPHFFKKNWVA